MRLIKLKLRHFQGVPSFELDTGGGDVSVYGDNGTGKTTLASACSWLLFGKDSLGRAQFDLKPLDSDGRAQHGMDVEVQATFELEGGRILELRKLYREVWTKSRGKAEREFSGHTTDHFVNGVPVQQKEYADQVAKVADPEVFRLLTSPAYFCEQLHWQKRRELLLQVCGDVSQEEVIASDAELAAELPAVLAGRTTDDARKVVAARRREVNQELERIPVRVDEARRALPETDGDRAAAEQGARLAEEADEEARAAVRRIETGGQADELRRQAARAETALLTARSAVRQRAEETARAEREPRERALGAAAAATTEARRAVDAAEAESARLAGRIDSIDSELKDLRDSWHDANAAACSGDETCPACGQDLPAEKVKSAREAFNQRKAERIEEIDRKGAARKAEREQLAAKREELEEALPGLREALAAAREAEEAARAAAGPARAVEPDFDADPACREAAAAKAQLEQRLAELRAGSEAELEPARARQAETAAALREARQRLARHDEAQRAAERIAELEAQQKALGAEFERLERALWLLDRYTRARVARLEGRINDRFRLVRFKLFREQVNGGLEECCEVTVGGVPYSSGLNNGARINAGLDVIRTLSEHFGVALPVFADNAEAVTRLLPLDAQLVRLVVSEGDKALRVVREGAAAAPARQLELEGAAA